MLAANGLVGVRPAAAGYDCGDPYSYPGGPDVYNEFCGTSTKEPPHALVDWDGYEEPSESSEDFALLLMLLLESSGEVVEDIADYAETVDDAAESQFEDGDDFYATMYVN